ncbi:conserved membrane domain protein [Mycobacterium xenopi 4042]|uniref:Conserved membrane domain protein n=1 Tax=Mycobacterium xenopi 4042 TaxID=1299334 RepID=X8CMN5_MYCXE|nr:conserved membrane domain protein [Mycobacterium xenopi 4042]
MNCCGLGDQRSTPPRRRPAVGGKSRTGRPQVGDGARGIKPGGELQYIIFRAKDFGGTAFTPS